MGPPKAAETETEIAQLDPGSAGDELPGRSRRVVPWIT